MADEKGQPVTVATAVVPVEADMSGFNRALDEIDDRLDELSAKAGKVLDPLKAGLAEVNEQIAEAREDTLGGILDPAGPTERGREGGEVTPLGPAAGLSTSERLNITMEDTNTLLRETNNLLQALIASQQQ